MPLDLFAEEKKAPLDLFGDAQKKSPITESLGNIPLGGGDIPAGLDPSAINLDTRKIAGKVAPFAPVATGTAASLVMSPVALATGPFAPVVEAGAFGAGYAGGKPIQSFLERYSKGGETKQQENPFVETAKALPEGLTLGMMNPILGKAMQVAGVGAYKGEEAIKKVVKEAYEKAIRPKVGGKGTAPLKEGFFDDVSTAIQTQIRTAREKPDYQLPNTVDDAAKLLHKTKVEVHKKYNSLSKEAGNEGAFIDRTPIIEDMKAVAMSPELLESPGGKQVSRELIRLAKEWEKRPIINPEQSENLIASLNASSRAFYANPNPHQIKLAPTYARYANLLKNKTSEAIESKAGPGWAEYRKEYGSQLAIEKEINDRATVASRQNIKGFFDLSSTFATGEFVYGLTKLDPSYMLSAAAMKASKDWIKWRNSPDRIIRNMYKEVDKLLPRIEKTPMSAEQKKAFNYIEGKVYEPGGLEPELLPAPAMRLGGQLQLPRGAQSLDEMYPQRLLQAPGYVQPEVNMENTTPLMRDRPEQIKAILRRLRNGELK